LNYGEAGSRYLQLQRRGAFYITWKGYQLAVVFRNRSWFDEKHRRWIR